MNGYIVKIIRAVQVAYVFADMQEHFFFGAGKTFFIKQRMFFKHYAIIFCIHPAAVGYKIIPAPPFAYMVGLLYQFIFQETDKYQPVNSSCHYFGQCFATKAFIIFLKCFCQFFPYAFDINKKAIVNCSPHQTSPQGGGFLTL